MGTYIRLVDYGSQQEKENAFLSAVNNTATEKIKFTASEENFSKIPGSPVAYWISKKLLDNFKNPISNYINCKTGLICGDNEKHIRLWQELNFNNIFFDEESLEFTHKRLKNWFPYNHGGARRRWYGNHCEVVELGNNGKIISQEKNAMLRNSSYYFKSGITWNRVGSGSNFAARVANCGFAFDDVSPSGFTSSNDFFYILSYMNTKVFSTYLKLFCTSIKTEIGHIQKVPYIDIKNEKIQSLGNQCVNISLKDWNSFESSWDFKRNPLI